MMSWKRIALAALVVGIAGAAVAAGAQHGRAGPELSSDFGDPPVFDPDVEAAMPADRDIADQQRSTTAHGNSAKSDPG